MCYFSTELCVTCARDRCVRLSLITTSLAFLGPEKAHQGSAPERADAACPTLECNPCARPPSTGRPFACTLAAAARVKA